MTEIMPYLMGAIIGAIIGYFTNWLAIKMLFRPHNEKRIGGVKVPFTPGLIPKEKARIAKSVAESIGEHLINHESIGNTLNKPEVKEKVKFAINKKASELLDKEGSLESRLKDILKDSYYVKEEKIEGKIYSKAIELVKNEERQEKLAVYATNFALEKLKAKPELIIKCIEKIDMTSVFEKISVKLESPEGTEYIAEKLDRVLDNLETNDNSIKSYIPEKAFSTVETIVFNNKGNIAAAIMEILYSDELSTKVKGTIMKDVLGGFGPLLGMFGGTDAIYDKLVNAIANALKDEANQEAICGYIVSYINKASENKVSKLAKELPAGTSVDIAVAVSQKVAGILKDADNVEKFKEKIIEFISEFDSYDAMLKKVDANYEERIGLFIRKAITKISESEQIEAGIKTAISAAKAELLSYDISKDDNAKSEIINSINEIYDAKYDDFIENDLQGVLEVMNIETIVEEQINSFETEEAEKMILDIADKELGAITWLGALLGGILGILSPVLSNIWR